ARPAAWSSRRRRSSPRSRARAGPAPSASESICAWRGLSSAPTPKSRNSRYVNRLTRLLGATAGERQRVARDRAVLSVDRDPVVLARIGHEAHRLVGVAGGDALGDARLRGIAGGVVALDDDQIEIGRKPG